MIDELTQSPVSLSKNIENYNWSIITCRSLNAITKIEPMMLLFLATVSDDRPINTMPTVNDIKEKRTFENIVGKKDENATNLTMFV